MTTAVVIVAGGSGTRLGSSFPKAFVSLAGRSLLERCIQAVETWHTPCSVIVVAPDGWVDAARELLQGASLSLTVVAGGETRTDSVRAGLAALPADTTRVLIHDAARALMPMVVFDRVLEALDAGALGVVPQVPVVDTLISLDPVSNITGGSVDRSVLGAVQTPQGFHAATLVASYQATPGDFTDDAAVLRHTGHTVVAVEGDARGFKITYPEDLRRAELMVAPVAQVRVGTALDVHQYDSDSPLWLAGLEWPGEVGLSGHSDGDAVLHAIVDALLQAAGLGDLGEHFGTSRPEFAGATSTVFVSHALDLIRSAGYQVSSVGVQVIAQTPKIGPRRREAEAFLSALVGAPVAVTATTTDGLGFTGRNEGLAALATVVLSVG